MSSVHTSDIRAAYLRVGFGQVLDLHPRLLALFPLGLFSNVQRERKSLAGRARERGREGERDREGEKGRERGREGERGRERERETERV